MWEVVHKGSGYAAVILSVAAMFEGLEVIEPTASSTVVNLYTAWFSITVFCFLVAQSECRKAVRKTSVRKLPTGASASAVSTTEKGRGAEPASGSAEVELTNPIFGEDSSNRNPKRNSTGAAAPSIVPQGASPAPHSDPRSVPAPIDSEL